MWKRLLARLLRRYVLEGRLVVTVGQGPPMVFGEGAPEVHVRLPDDATVRRILADPELALGECYMEGLLQIENDDIQGLMALVMRNSQRRGAVFLPARLRGLARRFVARRGISAHRARRNVAHHYDLTPQIYDLFLDSDRQYSCAYFAMPGSSLEAAQQAKKRHIARKLLLQPGMSVLDIGCGWGGLSLTLAREFGARVTGITLSEEQLAIARQRAADAGLSDRVTFLLADYRKIEGRFDRIVSVGMFEHVGIAHFATYFETVRDHLTEDGVALIHTIGSTAMPQPTNPWIEKYIFPGGYVPTLSEVSAAIQQAGLRVGDIECLRLHYAMTLRNWFDRFSARAEEARDLCGERFVRMWRYYLSACEQTFRHTGQDVFQFQLCRRADAVPITRDYLYA